LPAISAQDQSYDICYINCSHLLQGSCWVVFGHGICCVMATLGVKRPKRDVTPYWKREL
jgi:hypothetical protein